VLPLTAALAGGLALPLMTTGARATAADSAALSATVVLRTPSSSEPLAQTGALPRSARLSRLQGTLPSDSDQTGLLAEARSLGLTVDAVTPWSVSVHGGASSVRHLQSLPEVSSVVLAGGPAPVPADAQVALGGAAFRTAYQASGAQPTGGVTPIIATIQFSGWDSTELAGYVANYAQLGVAKPPALPSAEYTAVSVDGSSTTGGGVAGGSTEVALDQESLYDTDPYAKQRAYFAQGSAAGLVAALNRIAVDAQNMPGLVALSISWTFCETSFGGAASQLDPLHQAMANVVAAGVTVFAASGDSGTDCNGTTIPGVAYPASDPLVVAVGGTSLTLNPTAETAWSGSGGGRSDYFPKGAATKRAVPDIAADADLNTGFTSWHDAGSGLGAEQTGGTSLASPVSAATYVAELGSRGAINGGLGDIHNALYSAPAADFRDITSGGNGTSSAGSGYDQVTGLGAPLWNPLVSRLLSQPVLQVPATSTSLVIPVTVSAPAGQAFLAWSTGSGASPAGCGTSAGKPATPQSVTVTADGTYHIWAVGYVGYQHCFIVSSTTVVSGHSGSPVTTTKPPVTTTPPTASPVTTSPVPAPTGSTLPVLPVSSPTLPPLTPAPPAIAPPTHVTISTDVTPPAVTLSAKQTSPATTALSYAWHATDVSGSGVKSVAATVYRDDKPVWTAQVPSDSVLRLNGVPGHAYRLGVVAVDVAGNVAGFTSDVVHLPYDDRSLSLGKGWKRSSSRTTFGGSYVKSSATGATASVKVTGSTFSLLTSTGPADGIVAVYVDGRHVRDISLYSKSAHADVSVLLVRFHSAAKHRITLLVRGTKAAHARGVAVVVDGLFAY
jgi:hypothetical protein